MKKNVVKTLALVFFLTGTFLSCEHSGGDPQEENTAEIKVSYNSQVIVHEGKIENALNDIYVNSNDDEFGELSITIENTGASELRLTGAPDIIKLSGSTGPFKISSQPAQTALKKGQTTTFTLRFKPPNANKLDVDITIPNSSKNAPEFTFKVYGQGKPEKPEIRIFKGEQEIAADGTISFGETLVSRSSAVSITVKNTGRLPLELTGDPLIKLSGAGADDFTIATQPTKNISVGNSSSFDITFTPEREGESGATITIENNASAFKFYINGTGKREYPVIELKNDDTVIEYNGEKTFGTVETGSTKAETFMLKNTGLVDLELIGTPLVQSSSTQFSITTQPSKNRLEPDESVQFVVTYTPNTEQLDDEADISILNNSQTSPFKFKVTGRPPKPALAIFDGTTEIGQNGTVDLGSVIISQSQNKELSIKNIGEGVLNLDISGISVSGDGAAVFSMPAKPGATISAGSTSTFTVRYTPTAMGEQSATISIPSNDKSRNPAVIIIKGTGAREYPVIELKNDATVIAHNGEKDFGRVEIGQTKTESFIIKNTGLVDLVLSGATLVSSSNAKFAIITQPQATVSPNEQTTFTVRYTPDVEQADSAEISISGNTQSSLFKFTVKGTGYTKKPQIVVKQNATSISGNGNYNVGSVATIKQKTITFTIGNTGEAPLTLSGEPRIQITDDAEGFFTVVQQPGSVPIAPGGTAETFIVRFSPTTTGTKTAKVKIISNSGGSQGEFIFTVSGTATEASGESRLNSLTFTKGKLDQQFHADIETYTLKVDAAETIIKVTPTTLNANITSLTVNGKAQSSGVASEDIIIATTPTIIIVATAENETVSSTYTITIQPVVNYSSTALSQLWISNMAGDDVEDMITFINSGDDFIWLSLPDTTQLKFKPVLVNSNATIKLNGTAIAHNTYTNGYNLSPGSATTTFTFTIISEDGENERSFTAPCRYFGTQWEKVGDFPIGGASGLSYYPAEHTVVTHNNQFILTNADEVFASPIGASWTKTATLADTINHYRHSSVVYNNTIYNIGGEKDIGGDTWEIANIVSYSTNGTLFTIASSVSGLTGGVLNHTSEVFNGAMYTLGGETQTESQTNAVWKSTNGTTWTKQTNLSWGARQGHASVVYNNKLYIMGGAYNDGNSEYRDVWSSTNGTTWTQETASAEWTGRNDHTVNANSKGMWLFGGNDGYFKKDLWFSPDGKTWTKALDAPFAERACHAAVVRDGYLYVFGGVNGSWEDPNYLIDIWRVYIGE